jgi:Tfp pilus assembly protein PilN
LIKINLLEEVKAGTAPGAAIKDESRKAAVAPEQKRKNIIFGSEIAVALIIIGIWYFTLGNKYDTLLNQKIEKDSELNKIKNLISEVEKFRERKNLLERQINLIEELKMKQQGPADLMMQLYENLPDQVALIKVKQEADTLNIDAEAMNDQSVSKFYENLDKSTHFEGIVPGKKIKTARGITFDLSCTFIINPEARAKQLAEGSKKRVGAFK